MSANYMVRTRRVNLGTLDASGANTIVFAPGGPVDIKRIVAVTTIAHTTTNAVITVAVRDVDNANSTTQGTFTLPFSGSATDDVQYVNFGTPSTSVVASTQPSQVGESASVVYGDDPDMPFVNAGQELALTSNGGGDAGTYQVYVEYFDLAFAGTNISGYSELTFTPA